MHHVIPWCIIRGEEPQRGTHQVDDLFEQRRPLFREHLARQVALLFVTLLL